jgi:hypothetical protein
MTEHDATHASSSVRWAVAGLALIALAFGRSAGDPPNPGAEGDGPAEEEMSDADDAARDALESSTRSSA